MPTILAVLPMPEFVLVSQALAAAASGGPDSRLPFFADDNEAANPPFSLDAPLAQLRTDCAVELRAPVPMPPISNEVVSVSPSGRALGVASPSPSTSSAVTC